MEGKWKDEREGKGGEGMSKEERKERRRAKGRGGRNVTGRRASGLLGLCPRCLIPSYNGIKC